MSRSRAELYLNQYKAALISSMEIQKEIDSLREERDQLTQMLTSDRVQSSPKLDRIGDLVAEIVDLQVDLIDAEAEALRNMCRVVNTIRQVEDPTLRTLLEYKYIEFDKGLFKKKGVLKWYTWQEIADKMYYSYSGIMTARRRALRVVDKLI